MDKRENISHLHPLKFSYISHVSRLKLSGLESGPVCSFASCKAQGRCHGN